MNIPFLPANGVALRLLYGVSYGVSQVACGEGSSRQNYEMQANSEESERSLPQETRKSPPINIHRQYSHGTHTESV